MPDIPVYRHHCSVSANIRDTISDLNDVGRSELQSDKDVAFEKEQCVTEFVVFGPPPHQIGAITIVSLCVPTLC